MKHKILLVLMVLLLIGCGQSDENIEFEEAIDCVRSSINYRAFMVLYDSINEQDETKMRWQGVNLRPSTWVLVATFLDSTNSYLTFEVNTEYGIINILVPKGELNNDRKLWHDTINKRDSL